MPVIETPSIWDYIAGAAGKGIDSYQAAKDRVEQQNAQNAGLLTQLFGAGAIDAVTLSPAISKVKGMGDVKVLPNAPERTRTPGTAENIAQQAGTAENQAKIRKADIVTRWGNGQHVTEEEAAIAGLPTQQDMAQMKAAKADPILEQAGKQYIDQAVLKMGGRLDPSKAIDVAQQAYQQYLKDYQQAGLGTLNDAQLKNAQRYFAGRAMEILRQQREDETRRLAALRDRSTIAPADRMFAQLTSLMENNRKTLEDFLKANPGIDVISSKYQSDAAIPTAFKGQVARYRRLQQREGDLQNAQSQLAMGVIPKNFAGLLTTQVGGAAPPPTSAVPDPLQQIKADFKAGKLTRKQIQYSKMITAQQKAEVFGSGNITLKK